MKRHLTADFGKRQLKTGRKMSFHAKWVEMMSETRIIGIAVKHNNELREVTE